MTKKSRKKQKAKKEAQRKKAAIEARKACNGDFQETLRAASAVYMEPEPLSNGDPQYAVEVDMDPYIDKFIVRMDGKDLPILMAFFYDTLFITKSVLNALMQDYFKQVQAYNRIVADLIPTVKNEKLRAMVLDAVEKHMISVKEIRTALAGLWAIMVNPDYPVYDERNNQVMYTILLLSSLESYRVTMQYHREAFQSIVKSTGLSVPSPRGLDVAGHACDRMLRQMHSLLSFSIRNNLTIHFYRKHIERSKANCRLCFARRQCARQDSCLYEMAADIGEHVVKSKKYTLTLLRSLVDEKIP